MSAPQPPDPAARAPDPAGRLAALTGALALGILGADTLSPRPLPLLVSAAAAAAICAMRPRAFPALALAACLLGAALAGARLEATRTGALAVGAARGADALLEGRVAVEPLVSAEGVRFVLAVARAEIDRRPLRVRERAWVSVRPAPAAPIAAGTLLRVDARLAPLATARSPGAERALRRRGIAARAYSSRDRVQILGRARDPLTVVASAGRAAVREAAGRVPARARGLLLGVTTGDTALLDPEDEADFRTTGLSHLLAVSGANVALVLASVAVPLRVLRAGRRLTLVVLAACVLAFCAITRFEPSVVRAGAMAAIALGGVALGARREPLVILAAATLALLAFDPFLLFSTGFQLSVLATLGLLVLALRIADALPPGPLWTAAAVTLGAQLAVAPLLVLRFGELSLVALAANLLAAPAVGPATIAGLVGAVAGAVWSPLGALAWLAVPPIVWTRTIARMLAHLPLASVATPTGVLGLGLAAGLTVAALALARGRRPRRLAPLLLVLALLASTGTWVRAATARPGGGLEVVMLDVGQGDAFVVRAPGGTMLVDGGGDPRVTLAALRREGVHRVDLLVLTHPHADHIDGLVPVAERYPIGRALDPHLPSELPSQRAIVAAFARRGIPRDLAVAGQAVPLGAARVEVLWPPRARLEATASDVNNNSIVLRVRYGAGAVLLAGELEEEGQQALLEAAPDALRGDVLKVAHHGSRRMIPEFYAATGARVALIPVGPNTYGHPAAETLIALRGMRVARSDLHGTVRVRLDGRGGLAVTTERATAAA